MSAEKWTYYELTLLIGVLHFAGSSKQVLSLATKAIEILREFKAGNRSDFLAGLIAYHTISRILHAKFFDDNHDINLEEKFASWFLKLEL